MLGRLTFATAMIAASAALAGPPPEGWEGSISKPMIACDKFEQVDAIAKVLIDTKGIGVAAQFKVFHDDVSAPSGEPACTFTAASNVVAGESKDLGEVAVLSGTTIHLWETHLGTSRGDWWILYYELPVPVEKPADEL